MFWTSLFICSNCNNVGAKGINCKFWLVLHFFKTASIEFNIAINFNNTAFNVDIAKLADANTPAALDNFLEDISLMSFKSFKLVNTDPGTGNAGTALVTNEIAILVVSTTFN